MDKRNTLEHIQEKSGIEKRKKGPQQKLLSYGVHVMLRTHLLFIKEQIQTNAAIGGVECSGAHHHTDYLRVYIGYKSRYQHINFYLHSQRTEATE